MTWFVSVGIAILATTGFVWAHNNDDANNGENLAVHGHINPQNAVYRGPGQVMADLRSKQEEMARVAHRIHDLEVKIQDANDLPNVVEKDLELENLSVILRSVCEKINDLKIEIHQLAHEYNQRFIIEGVDI
ncbi:MAG: hypothetical protein ACK5PQ_05045 [Alphaproteobacteria bacterium]